MTIRMDIPVAATPFAGLRRMQDALREDLPGLIGAWDAHSLPQGPVGSWMPVVGEAVLTQTQGGRYPVAERGTMHFAGGQSLGSGDILSPGETLTLGLRFRIEEPERDIQNLFGRETATVAIYRNTAMTGRVVAVGTSITFTLLDGKDHALLLTRSATEDLADLDGEIRTAPYAGGWDAAHFTIGHYLKSPVRDGLRGAVSRVIAMTGSPDAAQRKLLRAWLKG